MDRPFLQPERLSELDVRINDSERIERLVKELPRLEPKLIFLEPTGGDEFEAARFEHRG